MALAVWLIDATGSAGWVAGSTIARFAPALVMSAYGGVLADRFERVRLMTLIDAVSCALMAVMAGLMAGSIGSGQIVSRTGRYKWLLAGAMTIATFGILLMTQLHASTSVETP